MRARRQRRCLGATAKARGEQAGYFTDHAGRPADDRDRARGLDVGGGMAASARTPAIGARETGPGMRWGVAGANAVARVRGLRFSDRWATYDLAA